MKSYQFLLLVVMMTLSVLSGTAFAQTSPGGTMQPRPCHSPPPGADWDCRFCYLDACDAWRDAWYGCAEAGNPMIIQDCREAHWDIYLLATAHCDIGCAERRDAMSQTDRAIVAFAQTNPRICRAFLDVFGLPERTEPIHPDLL